MKKVKIKRKRNTNIFSTRSLLLIFIAIIVFSSSAYAIFQESLTITGTVSGNLENYTYYFKAPSGWGNTMNAYYWNSSDTSTMSEPFKQAKPLISILQAIAPPQFRSPPPQR